MNGHLNVAVIVQEDVQGYFVTRHGSFITTAAVGPLLAISIPQSLWDPGWLHAGCDSSLETLGWSCYPTLVKETEGASVQLIRLLASMFVEISPQTCWLIEVGVQQRKHMCHKSCE
eukprot:jgi/Botrbrau1/5262/Bobra.0172s0121.1